MRSEPASFGCASFHFPLGLLLTCNNRNWGLTPAELLSLPPALARSFSRKQAGGFGADMGDNWGKLLMRGERNAELYGPLQVLYEQGRERGMDVWMHKNRCVQWV